MRRTPSCSRTRELVYAKRTWRSAAFEPKSMPGVIAGSLLVFIPAAGDFVNAYYLGSVKTTMIGNVVQNQFLVQVNYPVAAALSFVRQRHGLDGGDLDRIGRQQAFAAGLAQRLQDGAQRVGC